MRFTAVFVTAALAVLARAADSSSTTDAVASATSSGAAVSSAQAEIIKCLDACKPGDVSCTSKCIAVPNPNTQQVNQTNDCVAACNKGTGTAADNLNYSNCVSGCIGKYYYTASGGTPSPTGAAGSGSDSGSSSGSGSGSQTAGASGTSTGATTASRTGSSTSTASGASSTASSAASSMHVAGPAVGFLGLIAAVLAL